jgi:hypothetical protein
MIFSRLDSDCDIIRILANVKFTSLISHVRVFDNQHMRGKLKLIGDDSFVSIMRKLFFPKEVILERVRHLTHALGSDSWMSIHSRGFYEQSNETSRSLACARAMYEEKMISHVFMATETTRMLKLAKEYIPASVLFYVSKKLVDDTNGEHLDSYSIRDAMDIAVAEWFLVGEAVFDDKLITS